MDLNINLNVTAKTFLQELKKILCEIFCHKPKPFRVELGMYVVKDNEKDHSFSITMPEVKDEEGIVIDAAELDVEVTSTDETVVQATYDPETGAGNIHIGSPGLASINATFSSNGTILGSVGAQFTVTHGDPASISGGSIVIDGLTEVEPT